MIMDEKTGLGKESRFEFKYVPTLTRTTRLGERRSTRFERPGVETLARLGLLAAFIGVVALGLGLMFAARVLPTNQLFYGMLA
jgi:hypothetical protein